MVELKDKSLLLSSKVYDEGEEEGIEESFHNYCVVYSEIIGDISNIIYFLTKLLQKGFYFNSQNLQINIINKIPKIFQESLSVKDYIEMLKENYENFNHQLILSYCNPEKFTSFIYGRMFQIILKLEVY